MHENVFIVCSVNTNFVLLEFINDSIHKFCIAFYI